MAYMSQEKKKEIEPVVKAICRRFGVKATLSVRHHSTLVLSITEGRVDFIGSLVPEKFSEQRLAGIRKDGYLDVNPHAWRDSFSGPALAFLSEVMPALNDGNWDHSRIEEDYFNVGWYVDVDIGSYRKPYRLLAAPAPSAPAARSSASAAARKAVETRRAKATVVAMRPLASPAPVQGLPPGYRAVGVFTVALPPGTFPQKPGRA